MRLRGDPLDLIDPLDPIDPFDPIDRSDPIDPMPTQQAVVQYALTPMSVELREVPVPDIGADDVLLRVGAVSVCGSDVHQAYGTHSWAVNIPVTLGHEFGGTVAAMGAERPRLPRRRPRRQRDSRRHLRQLRDVPLGPLQPLSVAQGIRLRRRRRHGRVREGAGAVPASRARLAADGDRVPHRAALRLVQRDVRERDDSAWRRGRRARSRTHRPSLHAHGRALRRQPAHRRGSRR